MNRKGGRAGPIRFVLCIESGEYPASLLHRKLYEARPAPAAEAYGQLRIIDDSGEHYLYPREYFQPRPTRRPTKVRAHARRSG
jgi:hypothetical protein